MIKLFNEYSGYLDKYYEKLTLEEYAILKKNKAIDISEKIYHKISSLPFDKRWHISTDSRGLEVRRVVLNWMMGMSNVIAIFQLEDDYFIVKTYNGWLNSDKYSYFKCDQWEGLVELFKDELYFDLFK